VSVYIDSAFTEGDWGKWSGGGHLQADTIEELHEFAARLGLKRSWVQLRPSRPEMDHYDCTRSKRELALKLGAVDEEDARGAARRTLARMRRRDAEGQDEIGAPHS
jgi:Ser/Thr protein kinase RdoA (MazF antagonist)